MPTNEIVARIGAAARNAEIAITTNDRQLGRRLANLITGLLLAEVRDGRPLSVSVEVIERASSPNERCWRCSPGRNCIGSPPPIGRHFPSSLLRTPRCSWARSRMASPPLSVAKTR